MKLRNLIVAGFVLLVLVVTLYWSDHRKLPSETAKLAAGTPPSILKLDEGTITRLELKSQESPPIVLAKGTSGSWQITQPKPLNADQRAVSGALATLSSLNSERLVDDKASDLKQYGLDHPNIEVDVSEKDNRTQKLLIGDPTPAGSAFYAALAGDPRVFTIATYNKTDIDKGLNDLRDKRLLTIETNKISRIEISRKNKTIEFGRSKDEWQILKPTALRADNLQVDELAQKLTSARMDLSGPAAEMTDTASAFLKGTPVAIAKVTDPSGTQELQVRKNKDAYYAKSNAVEGIYKVDSDLGQALDKDPDEFRNKKLFDFGFGDPDKVEMHSGPKAYFLTKGGLDWWSNGKKMDAASVQSFIENLRDFSASKFADSGLSNPAIEITVASNDGKRVEKVVIAKSGTSYVAKRENESTIYELQSSAVVGLEKAANDIKPAAAPAK